MSTHRDTSITVWADKRLITIYIGEANGFHAVCTLSPDAAKRLAAEIVRTVEKLPRVVEASDLGLEAA